MKPSAVPSCGTVFDFDFLFNYISHFRTPGSDKVILKRIVVDRITQYLQKPLMNCHSSVLAREGVRRAIILFLLNKLQFYTLSSETIFSASFCSKVAKCALAKMWTSFFYLYIYFFHFHSSPSLCLFLFGFPLFNPAP